MFLPVGIYYLNILIDKKQVRQVTKLNQSQVLTFPACLTNNHFIRQVSCQITTNIDAVKVKAQTASPIKESILLILTTEPETGTDCESSQRKHPTYTDNITWNRHRLPVLSQKAPCLYWQHGIDLCLNSVLPHFTLWGLKMTLLEFPCNFNCYCSFIWLLCDQHSPLFLDVPLLSYENAGMNLHNISNRVTCFCSKKQSWNCLYMVSIWFLWRSSID